MARFHEAETLVAVALLPLDAGEAVFVIAVVPVHLGRIARLAERAFAQGSRIAVWLFFLLDRHHERLLG